MNNPILNPVVDEQLQDRNKGHFRYSMLLFSALVALNCIWVFSLPLFPSQDGAVHLYYVSIIHHLMSGSELFSQYYALRHPIPPYSFQYLLLFLLTNFVGYLVAEKIVICLVIVAFCFGFRFLVTGVSKRGETLAFCSIPLSLNWMLGMGFVNYCLSLAFSLFAVGLWMRFAKSGSLVTGAAFIGTVVLILFTHPVPLLIVLAFVWSEIALQVIQKYLGEHRRTGSFANQIREQGPRIGVAFLASCSLAYVFLFVSTRKTGENLHHPFIQRGMIKDYILLHPLVLTFGTPGAKVYRAFLYAFVIGAFAVAWKGFFRRLRQRNLQAGDLLVAGAASLGLIYPFLPRSINGSDFFADRLALYIWLFAIAGAAWELSLNLRREAIFVGVLACVTLLSLAVDDAQIRPTAQALMEIESDKLSPRGTKGIFISAPIQPSNGLINFDPYLWSSARYFRRANLVMLNAPWLDLPILPVGPAPKLFTNSFPARILNYPDRFVGGLLKSQDIRNSVSPKMDFMIFTGFSSRDPRVVDNVLKQKWPHPWNCSRTGWYSVCSD